MRRVEECGARGGTWSRGCSSLSRCPWGAPGEPAGGPSRVAGGSAGRAELLVLGLDARSLWPREPQVGREPSRGGRGQGPAPRPAAAPGGSSPAARPTRWAGWQRPARATWPFEGRRPGPPATWQASPETFPSSHSRRIFPSGCLPFCLVLPSSLHCPHSWWSRPRPAPPTFADVELSQPYLPRAYFSLAKRKKSRGEVFERWKPGEGRTFK